ncbi:UPF0711 protein C18orf21-like [Centruroides vittatus]|uniref:UPF0711 protein C18orf21-like n=1 Tax=Centruroides vittatus TaxID=120091 RepID=UPI00350ED7B4
MEFNNDALYFKTIKHLQKLGTVTQHSEISKYFLSLGYAAEGKLKIRNEKESCPLCKNCFNPLLPDNCKIRIYPRPVVSKQILRLHKKEQSRSWNLSMKDKKKLARFKSQSNKIVCLCLNCKKTTKYSGSKLPKLPVSETPASTSKLFFNRSSLKERKRSNISILSASILSSNGESSKMSSSMDVLTPERQLNISNLSFNSTNSVKSSGNRKMSLSFNNSGSSQILKNNSNEKITPKPKKKNSLLQQLLLEQNQKKQNDSSNSLSAFLSSI